MAQQENLSATGKRRNSSEPEGSLRKARRSDPSECCMPLTIESPPPFNAIANQPATTTEDDRDLTKVLNDMADRCTALEMNYSILKLESLVVALHSTKAEKALYIMEKKNKDLIAALTSGILDVQVGHCNNCGEKFNYDHRETSPCILERCGAPWCHRCIIEQGCVCAHHSHLGLQQSHRVFDIRCLICKEGKATKMIDMRCGHPVCRGCLRSWLSFKGKAPESSLEESTLLFTCSLCGDSQECCDLFALPSLEHSLNSKRMTAWTATEY